MISWCEKHAGQAAARMLRKMQNTVGFEGERPEKGTRKLPASGKAYYLRVLKPDPEFENKLVRREMQFLCALLDHLVLGRSSEAADFVTQRLKALMMSAKDGSWDRAKYLELIPAHAEMLTSNDEYAVVRSEMKEAKKANLAAYEANSWKFEKWQPKASGKGSWKNNVSWNKWNNKKMRKGERERWQKGRWQERLGQEEGQRLLSRLEAMRKLLNDNENDPAADTSYCSIFFGKCQNVSDVRLGLALLGQCGWTGPGRINGLLNNLVDTTYPGDSGPEGMNLLPVAPKLAESFLKSIDEAARESHDISNEWITICMGVISALNFLFCAGWTDHPLIPRSLGPLLPAQQEFLRRISHSVNFSDFSDDPFSFKAAAAECTSRKISYSGDMVSVKRDLIADKVIPAWPKVGKACVVSMHDVVDSQLAADLENPEHCLLPENEWPSITPRSKVYASDDE